MKRVYRDPLKELQRRQANRAHFKFQCRQTLKKNREAQQAAALLAPGRLLDAFSNIKKQSKNER